MAIVYLSGAEEALHKFAIEALAIETHRPIARVRVVYEDVLARLKADARITDYLPVIASRRARETLRSSGAD